MQTLRAATAVYLSAYCYVAEVPLPGAAAVLGCRTFCSDNGNQPPGGKVARGASHGTHCFVTFQFVTMSNSLIHWPLSVLQPTDSCCRQRLWCFASRELLGVHLDTSSIVAQPLTSIVVLLLNGWHV
jgi:hypothetical protein